MLTFIIRVEMSNSDLTKYTENRCVRADSSALTLNRVSEETPIPT